MLTHRLRVAETCCSYGYQSMQAPPAPLALCPLSIFTRFENWQIVWTNEAISGFQTRRWANLLKLGGDDSRPNHQKNQTLSFFEGNARLFLCWTEANMREHKRRRPLESSRVGTKPVNLRFLWTTRQTRFILKKKKASSSVIWMSGRRKQWCRQMFNH